MKRGKLSHLGALSDLRQQVSGVEVIVTRVTADALSKFLPKNGEFQLTTSPAGLRIEVPDEKNVDDVIGALRNAGGKLVAVQPLKQSLEELFLN
jgi:hypothetical protein